MKKEIKNAAVALGMAFGLMVVTLSFGAVFYPHDLAVIWIGKGVLVGIGSILTNFMKAGTK